MSSEKAYKLIQSAGEQGHFFTVKFYKRSTGELRTMNCRMGVTRHLKGGSKAYDASAHQLITVYDIQKKGYRSIALEGVVSVNGEPV